MFIFQKTVTERRGHAAVRRGLLNHGGEGFVSKSTFSEEVFIFSGLLIVGEEAEEATEEKQDSCGICGSFMQD